MDKRSLLDKLTSNGEERMLLARVLDKELQAERRNVLTATDFLTPQEQQLAGDLLRLMDLTEDRWTAYGGYEDAERRTLLFLPDWLDADAARQQAPIRYLRAEYRPEYELTHRDLLGSLMGLGIVREKVGDLLVTPESCDLIVEESVADFLLQNWLSAGRAKLKISELQQENLHMPEVRRELIRDTVAALRLDAITAAGFRMSRGKAAALIASGRVQVNWRECTKPDKPLNQGDTVSARGFGKFVLAEVGGLTKKGRMGITVERYC